MRISFAVFFFLIALSSIDLSAQEVPLNTISISLGANLKTTKTNTMEQSGQIKYTFEHRFTSDWVLAAEIAKMSFDGCFARSEEYPIVLGSHEGNRIWFNPSSAIVGIGGGYMMRFGKFAIQPNLYCGVGYIFRDNNRDAVKAYDSNEVFYLRYGLDKSKSFGYFKGSVKFKWIISTTVSIFTSIEYTKYCLKNKATMVITDPYDPNRTMFSNAFEIKNPDSWPITFGVGYSF